MVPFVGLTGGIGSGKSTALAALERLGCATLSTDQVVHDLYRTPEVIDSVTARFGEQVAPAGVVDRSALAEAAFAAPEGRKWLEELLWPLVGRRMAQWREGLESLDPVPVAAVVEVPLLFESGMEAAFDATVSVLSDETVRAERAGARGHRFVDERAARQLSQQEKAARSTYVVLNDGSVEELEYKLAEVLAKMSQGMSGADERNE